MAPRIVRTPGTCGGAPRIRNRRIPVRAVVGYLAGGWSIARICRELKVGRADVEAALRYHLRETGRRAQRSAERRECPVHEFMRHGQEAQELRRGVETLLASLPSYAADLGGDDARDELDGVRRALDKLLDDVDARDSLAYLERQTPAGAPSGGSDG